MKIGTIIIDDYIPQSGLIITREARNQVTTTNLMGDNVIDRGKLKFKISIKLNALTNNEYAPLIAILEKPSFNVTFFDALEGEITREFNVSSIPSPKFIQAGSTYYYKDISLEMKEL